MDPLCNLITECTHLGDSLWQIGKDFYWYENSLVVTSEVINVKGFIIILGATT